MYYVLGLEHNLQRIFGVCLSVSCKNTYELLLSKILEHALLI